MMCWSQLLPVMPVSTKRVIVFGLISPTGPVAKRAVAPIGAEVEALIGLREATSRAEKKPAVGR